MFHSSTSEVPMPTGDLTQRARELYLAFAAGDRDSVEQMLADEFTFSSPIDVALDRAGYFERCWPGAGQGQQFEFARLVEAGNEVIVTYELTRRDGRRGRNTEILTFDGDRIIGAEVYFGWNL
jgi:SnoaL-like domain